MSQYLTTRCRSSTASRRRGRSGCVVPTQRFSSSRCMKTMRLSVACYVPGQPFPQSILLRVSYTATIRCDRRPFRLGAFFHRAFLPTQTERRVDQTDVTIGLRKIAQHAPGQRIKFLGEQTHVIAAQEQAGEQLARFRTAALQYVIVDEPKAARKESSFAFGKSVSGVFGCVAKNELTLDQKSILDRPKCSADPRILGRKKADHRDQQQTGIEPLGAVGLHKAVKVAVKTELTDLGLDFVGDFAPSPPRLVKCLGCQLIRRPIESDPSHDLRMNKVLPAATH